MPGHTFSGLKPGDGLGDFISFTTDAGPRYNPAPNRPVVIHEYDDEREVPPSRNRWSVVPPA
ncbi:MAG TPA: hypothetical protein VGM20_14340 [Gemmatimonadales bacterium]|jgi:hypothetical protein